MEKRVDIDTFLPVATSKNSPGPVVAEKFVDINELLTKLVAMHFSTEDPLRHHGKRYTFPWGSVA